MISERYNIKESILNRIIDDTISYNENDSYNFDIVNSINLGKIKKNVIKDIEYILNSRCQILSSSLLETIDSLKEIQKSLFLYGLKDFTAKDINQDSVKQDIKFDIKKNIERFEPRLKNISISNFSVSEKSYNEFRFTIYGILIAESVTESIAFDTVFDGKMGKYKIYR